MASPEQAAADEFVLAENMYADGVEALEQSEFYEATDFLAQCLEFHAKQSGDTSVDAALVALKYAEALLGSARMKGSNILGGMAKNTKAKDPKGASTSSGTAEAAQPEEAAEDETGGEEDLDLAWEVAETARIGMTNNSDSARITKDTLTELYQLLGDVCAERELFPEALIDYEQALVTVTELEELDPRWEAEIHLKVSIVMEIMDRGPEAQQHIQSAIKMMSKLVKEKNAELAEMKKAAAASEQSQKPAVEAAATAPATEAEAAPVAEAETVPAAEPEAAPATGAEAAPAEGTAATTETDGQKKEAAAATAGNDKEKAAEEEEGDDIQDLEDEIKEIQGLVDELQERSKDLVAQKQQEAAIKEQLRVTLGIGAAQLGIGAPGTSQGADGTSAGTSSAAAGIMFGGSTLENDAKPAEGATKADATAQDGVQDLGVISSKRKWDTKVVDSAPDAKASKPAVSESEVENVDVAATGDATV